ncbi:hypothetical protein [Blastomonas fulva]|uniref:hypothetical protein n=1 Tax=Blastomonas fulva TaxID=1550728 RepID=UPI003D26A61E
MLKEVMLGSGGIMLAAAIFASSMTPGTMPAPAAPQQPAQVVAAPPPAPVAAAPRPAAVFPEDTGDIDFGAPMIEAVPVETGLADPAVNTAAPDSAEAAGGRQFYARPGSPNPVPR